MTTTFTPLERETLLKAADEIDRRGLWKGSFYERQMEDAEPDVDLATCRVCVFGAVNYVLEGHPDYSNLGYSLMLKAQDALVDKRRSGEHLSPRRLEYLTWLPHINDAEETKKEDIVSILRSLAGQS